MESRFSLLVPDPISGLSYYSIGMLYSTSVHIVQDSVLVCYQYAMVLTCTANLIIGLRFRVHREQSTLE